MFNMISKNLFKSKKSQQFLLSHLYSMEYSNVKYCFTIFFNHHSNMRRTFYSSKYSKIKSLFEHLPVSLYFFVKLISQERN